MLGTRRQEVGPAIPLGPRPHPNSPLFSWDPEADGLFSPSFLLSCPQHRALFCFYYKKSHTHV